MAADPRFTALVAFLLAVPELFEFTAAPVLPLVVREMFPDEATLLVLFAEDDSLLYPGLLLGVILPDEFLSAE